jgi:hypothetical protein
MLRVWIAEEKLHCSLKIGMYRQTMNVPEAAAWGVILADVTRHIAMAMEEKYSLNKSEVMQKIRDKYLIELGDPTSEAKGEFV